MKRKVFSNVDHVYKDRTRYIDDGTNPPWEEVDSQMSVHSAEGAIGYNLEDYAARRKRGDLLPVTPWFRWKEYGIQSFAYTLNYTSGYSQTCPWTPFSSTFPCPPGGCLEQVDSDYLNYLVQAAAADIYSSGFDGLTFVTELKLTARMFKGMIGRLSRLVKQKKVQDLWLESRYGWRILYYDMKNISELIESLDERFTRFKKSKRGNSSSDSTNYVQHILGGAATVNLLVADAFEISYRGIVVADITPPKVAFNPVTTAWEVTRLSFVIDWMWNVGQWLEAMSFLCLADNHTAAAGVKVSCLRQVTVDSIEWQSGWSGSVSGSATFTTTVQDRKPAEISLIPQTRLRLNALKVLDLLALAVQAVIRRK